MVKVGFHQSMHDYFRFIKRTNKDIIMLLIYVEDIVITSSKDALIKGFKSYLQSLFV